MIIPNPANGHNAILPKPMYANLSSDVNNTPKIYAQRVN